MSEAEQSLNVFIDTSTLEECAYKLDYPLLRRIFDAEHLVLHTTSITLREMYTRIKHQVNKHRQSTAEAAKWSDSSVSIAGAWRDPDTVVREYRRLCAHEHAGRGVDLHQLVDLFLQGAAPFSAGKPDEFKDAIAALSLHHWAEQERKQIYIIAKDPDWKDACRIFRRFTHVTLAEVHAHLFRLDAQHMDLDEDSITASLLERGKSELDEKLRLVDPDVIGEDPDDIDAQFVDVLTMSLRILDATPFGVELLVHASFTGFAQIECRERPAEAVISGALKLFLGVGYAFHRVEVEQWAIMAPSKVLATASPHAPNDES